MKKTITIFLFSLHALVLTAFSTLQAQTVLARWNFESVSVSSTSSTTPSLTSGSPVADSGSVTAGSAFTGLHMSTSAWSNPAGNGSTKSLSVNTWTVGDYFQFVFSTTGYSGISIAWDQTGSNTGPRDFKVQYSTDGSSFTDATGTNSTYSLIVSNWSTGTKFPEHNRALNLSGVSALNNQSTIYIRLVNTATTSINAGTVAAGGTGRVDNFIVTGTLLPSEAGFVASKSSINFGTVISGQKKKDSLYVKNAGATTLNISSIASDNTEFTVTPISAALVAGDSAWFSITFAPTSVASKSGNIIFTHDASSSPDTVKVDGAGTTPPPPAISNITRPYTSRVPNAGDSVVVTAKVKDQSGLANVRLIYSVNDIRDSVAMTAVNDTTYTGKIPRSVNQNGVRVEYQIRAISTSGKDSLTAKSAANAYFAGLSKISLSGIKKSDVNLLNLYKGYYAKVTGVINGPNYQAANLAQYIQDDSGGVNLFRSGTLADTLNLGDSIIVIGKLDQFRGTTEIVPDSSAHGKDIQVVSTGKTVTPITLTVPKFNANPELYESRLVRFAGLNRKYTTPVWPGQPGNLTITFYQTSQTDTMWLFINAGVSAVNAPEPTYPVTITGIAVQFTSSGGATVGPYEILSRYVTDFEKTTGVIEKINGTPLTFVLDQNYPNPFNPTTIIHFGLPQTASTKLVVYDLLGREVRTLANTQMEAGYYSLSWDGRNNRGETMASGVYVYRIEAGTFVSTKKMMLLK